MKKLTFVIVSVLMIFSSVTNAKNNDEFDLSKYKNVYSEYIANKKWKLDVSESKTRIKFEDYVIKSVPLPLARGDGEYYQRFGYLNGRKTRDSKFIDVRKHPENSQGYLYIVYDRMTGSLLEKVKIDNKGRLIMDMDTSNKDTLVFDHLEPEVSGCRTNEDEMECLKRLDPKEYLRKEKERFRKESRSSN